MTFWPLLMTIFILWTLRKRTDFAVKVCLCDYKEIMGKSLGFLVENDSNDYQKLN